MQGPMASPARWAQRQRSVLGTLNLLVQPLALANTPSWVLHLRRFEVDCKEISFFKLIVLVRGLLLHLSPVYLSLALGDLSWPESSCLHLQDRTSHPANYAPRRTMVNRADLSCTILLYQRPHARSDRCHPQAVAWQHQHLWYSLAGH